MNEKTVSTCSSLQRQPSVITGILSALSQQQTYIQLPSIMLLFISLFSHSDEITLLSAGELASLLKFHLIL